MFQLFSVHCEETGIDFKCDLPEDCSNEDVGDALDEALNNPDSLTVRNQIINQAASCLFPDDLQYVLDYASKRSIPVDLDATVQYSDHPSIQKYLTYLRQHQLSIPKMLYDRIIHILIYSPNLHFVAWVKMLARERFTISETTQLNRGSLVHRLIRSVCYHDMVQLLGHPKSFTSDTILMWLDVSIQNPDTRVFDTILDALHDCPPDTHRLNSDIPYLYDPNLRSLTKLIKFVLSRKYAKGEDDPSCRFRISFKMEELESMALLGPFKDPLFIDMVLEIGKTRTINFDRATRDRLKRMDQLADQVITCLRSKLPNVLVDLVLDYLV